jgi:DNA-binding CsgD family transcriptional regulator
MQAIRPRHSSSYWSSRRRARRSRSSTRQWVPVTDLAARLCDEAPPGQILASQRVCGAAQDVMDATATGPLALRGFIRSVSALRILGLAPATPNPPDVSPLSPREEELAALVAGGATNREIGNSLSIAERTVAAHIEHILGKLGFTSRTQIGVWAAARQRAA